MNGVNAATQRSKARSVPRMPAWVVCAAGRVLPGALFALALLLPLWRYRILWHLKVEDVFFELHDVMVYASDVLVMLVIGVWALSPARQRLAGLPHWLVLALAALAALATVSAAWATLGWLALYHAGRLWLLFGLFLAVGTAREARGALAWGLLASAAIQAAIGLGQFAIQGPLGLREFGEVIMRPEWSGASVITVGGARVIRAYGLTQHPNILGGVLMTGVLIGAGLALSRQRSRWPSALAIALTALAFAGLLWTFSRAAWAGAAIGSVALIALLPPRSVRRSIPSGTVVGLIAALVITGSVFLATQWPMIRPRLGLTVEGVEIRSVDERAGLEAGAQALIAQAPWLGVGYANFSMALLEARPATLEAYPTFQPVHRVPLLARAELGLAGLLLWAALVMGPWIAVVAARGTWPAGGFSRPLAAAVMGALTGLAAIGWFDFYPWFSQQGRMMVWVLSGLLAQSLSSTPREA